MFYFLIILLFIAAALFGLLSVSITEKGRVFLLDTWASIRELFAKKADPELAEYGCSHIAEEFRTAGGIIPVDSTITWYLDVNRLSRTLSRDNTLKGLKEGLSFLQDYMGKVVFKEVTDPAKAQVVIGFYRNGQSGLPQNFGSNTLAYAFLGNRTTAFNIAGDMFFNDNFKWANSHGNGYVDFIKVFIHESLHAIPGLHHQTIDSKGILYPAYHGPNPLKMIQDTKNALKHLYGKYDGPKDVVPEVPVDADKTCKDQITKLNKDITVLNKKVTSSDKKVVDLTKKLDVKTKEVVDLKKELVTANKKVSSFSKAIKVVITSLSKLI